MREGNIRFVAWCIVTGGLAQSLYLLGVWILGSVNVFESIILSTMTFAVAAPLALRLEKRIQPIAEVTVIVLKKRKTIGRFLLRTMELDS